MSTTSRAVSAGHRDPWIRRRAVAIPILIATATLGLLAWSAWPMLRPARDVVVIQAVYDRSSPEQAGRSSGAAQPESPTVQAPGWLEAEPFVIAVPALADGVLESIEVLEGDAVLQGQVIARLIAVDSEIRLQRAEADLAAAAAQLGIALAELDAAQRAWDDPVILEREVATSRAALAEVEAELAQLPFLVASSQATLTQLNEEAKRVRRSTEQNATNELELIVANQRATAQQAGLEALQTGELLLAARADRFLAEYRAAERSLALRIDDRRRLASAEESSAYASAMLARAQADRDMAALEFDRMVIRAPITGYVQRRLKAPGDKVVRMMDSPHSSHIVELYDPARLQVRVDVPLADASHISMGQACEVIVEVLPGRVFRGVVLRATHEADLQKNTLQFKVKVLDPDPILRPQMLTRVKFLPANAAETDESAGAASAVSRVILPQDAVDRSGIETRVWVVTNRRNGRGVLASRTVRVITESADGVTLEGSIQPGALVTVGVDKPKEGQAVTYQQLRHGEAS